MRNHGEGIMQPQTSKIVHYWYFTNHTETLAANIHHQNLPSTCGILQERRTSDNLECACPLHACMALSESKIAESHPEHFWRQMDQNEYQICKGCHSFHVVNMYWSCQLPSGLFVRFLFAYNECTTNYFQKRIFDQKIFILS